MNDTLDEDASAAVERLQAARDGSVQVGHAAACERLAAAIEEAQHVLRDMLNSSSGAPPAESAGAYRARSAAEPAESVEAWDRQARRYELAEIVPGVFGFALKKGMEEGEPAHWLCANCFYGRMKGILQFEGRGPLGDMLKCQRCQSTLRLNGPFIPGTARQSRRRSP